MNFRGSTPERAGKYSGRKTQIPTNEGSGIVLSGRIHPRPSNPRGSSQSRAGLCSYRSMSRDASYPPHRRGPKETKGQGGIVTDRVVRALSHHTTLRLAAYVLIYVVIATTALLILQVRSH